MHGPRRVSKWEHTESAAHMGHTQQPGLVHLCLQAHQADRLDQQDAHLADCSSVPITQQEVGRFLQGQSACGECFSTTFRICLADGLQGTALRVNAQKMGTCSPRACWKALFLHQNTMLWMLCAASGKHHQHIG